MGNRGFALLRPVVNAMAQDQLPKSLGADHTRRARPSGSRTTTISRAPIGHLHNGSRGMAPGYRKARNCTDDPDVDLVAKAPEADGSR